MRHNFLCKMDKKQFIENIVPKLDQMLSLLGFEFKKSKELFVKKNPNGRVDLLIGHYKIGSISNVNLTLGIRINSIEEILAKYTHTNPINLKESLTVIFSSPKWKEGNNERVFRFSNEEELN